MLHHSINLKTTFYSEVGIGILANTILFLSQLIKFLFDKRLKNTDLIIGLLALIHLLMILTVGFIAPDSFVSQGWVQEDITCKSVANLYRLMRGLSVSASCLLTMLQAITLSPRSSCLAKFKPKSPQDSLRSLLYLWLFYMSFSAHFSVSAVDNSTVTSQGLLFLSDSCIIFPMSYILRLVFSILGAFRDVFLIGLMVLSSGYMVTLLNRHKRQTKHLHSTRLSPKACPEQRATWTILLLMSFFMFMYCLDCIISFSRTMWNSYPVCPFIVMMVANGYATISPLVFIFTAKQCIQFLTSIWRKDSECFINS